MLLTAIMKIKKFKKIFKVLVLTAIIFLWWNAKAQELITFSKGEKQLNQFSLNNLKSISKPVKVKVFDPHENSEIIYEGLRFVEVLNKVYGNSWKKADMIYIVCADGFKAPIQRATVELNTSYLAFRKFDKQGRETAFQTNNITQNEKEIELKPLYLVWDDKNNPDIRADGATNWPYQIVAIELWNYDDKFKKMIPRSNSSENVKNGFVLTQKYCTGCHSFNGEGGGKGGELASSHVLANLEDLWLRRWIDNPKSLKSDTTMPPLNVALRNRDAQINNIILYLREITKVQ